MEEIWKPVPGWPQYEASSLGNIRSIDRMVKMLHRTGKTMYVPRAGKVLVPYSSCHPKSKSPKGYLKVTLGKTKKLYVHRIVASAWCAGYKEGYQVDHKNRDTLDNRPANLEWVSPEENQKRVTFKPKNRYLGISKRGDKWGAWRHINGKSTYLGAADTPEEAHALYLSHAP